jgi:proline racemase
MKPTFRLLTNEQHSAIAAAAFELLERLGVKLTYSEAQALLFGAGAHMVDRSPCGTGTCAEVELRYARGQLGLGEPFVTESIIGKHFTGQGVAETQVGSCLEVFPVVIPTVTGRAYITGFHWFVLDGEDPFPEGIRLKA